MDVKIIPSKTIPVQVPGNTFTFEFDYLRKAFVHVVVNEVEQTPNTYEVKDKTIVFNEPLSVGDVLTIYRSTPTTRLVSWQDASVLKAKDMTIQQVQELHILEEEDFKFNGVLEGAEAARDKTIEVMQITEGYKKEAEASKQAAKVSEQAALNSQNAAAESEKHTENIIAAGFFLADDLTVVDGKVCLVFNE